MFVEMCLFNNAALKSNNSFMRNRTGEYSAGKEKDRERMREKGERVRDRVLLEKGCGVSHKLSYLQPQ